MKISSFRQSICNPWVASAAFCIALAAIIAVPCVDAQGDYYRHVIFDNSLTHDTYYHSQAQTNGQSFVDQQKGRLPVDSEHFRTPPNAIRLTWQSAPDSGWNAQISMLNFRNRRPGVDGHNLYFWLYSPAPISAADLPKLVLSTSPEGLQVAEFPASFSTPIPLGKYSGNIPAGKWIEVRIPLPETPTASIYPFNPAYLQSLTFLQDRADNARHTLSIDEIRVANAPTAASIAAPTNLHATGYDRHIELDWSSVESAGLARYVIYRSLD